MKIKIHILLLALLSFSQSPLPAQLGPLGGPGSSPTGPDFSGNLTKLFGDNKAFSATLEILAKDGTEETTIPGKLAFDDGQSRFELDMMQIKNSRMPPEAAAQMKTMGMDTMVVITLPQKKVNYMIYPGLQAYAELPANETSNPEKLAKFKVDTTELGKETFEGQACIKNRVVVTDDQGKPHESTVWNAIDLKKFPIKIETVEKGTSIVMLFKDVKLVKPDSKLFSPPTGLKRYDSIMALMQAELMKRMGGPGLTPPAR